MTIGLKMENLLQNCMCKFKECHLLMCLNYWFISSSYLCNMQRQRQESFI